MKIIQKILGNIFAICLIFILLFTSIEYVLYGNKKFYENEYIKYNVLDDVPIEMSELLNVTDTMMEYLRGNKANLHTSITLYGNEQEFFNEKEISHLKDVKKLFLTAYKLRTISVILAALCIILLILMKSNVIKLIAKSIFYSVLAFLLIVLIISILLAIDFSKCFDIFHEILFNNDLWLLNPNTDLLINILPEGFFIDTAIRIGITFGLSSLILFILSIFLIKK